MTHSAEKKRKKTTESTLLSKTVIQNWREKEFPKPKVKEFIATKLVLQEMLQGIKWKRKKIHK